VPVGAKPLNAAVAASSCALAFDRCCRIGSVTTAGWWVVAGGGATALPERVAAPTASTTLNAAVLRSHSLSRSCDWVHRSAVQPLRAAGGVNRIKSSGNRAFVNRPAGRPASRLPTLLAGSVASQPLLQSETRPLVAIKAINPHFAIAPHHPPQTSESYRSTELFLASSSLVPPARRTTARMLAQEELRVPGMR